MYTPIKLDKVRNLRYGMVALDLIEQSLGMSIQSLDLDNLTMRQLGTVIWAGLYHEDKNLTVEKVMELVDEYSNIVEVVEIMSQAFQKAFSGKAAPPEDKEGKN